MSDDKADGAGTGDAAAAGMAGGGAADQAQRRFQTLPMSILAQYIKDFSFENPGAPGSLRGQTNPKVGIEVSVTSRPVGEAVFEVVLSLRADGKDGETTVFLVELSYAGVISLQGVPAEHVQPILMIEGPRLLFPFARAIIASATRDGGYPPLMLNPIDFVSLYRRQANDQAAQASDQMAAAEPAGTA